ncbi:MAG TPA: hypothetical protein ENO24_07320, partial [Chloroflexi bacterium]|nr:hypothetical protein [Chloroflexota bacterium]
VTTDHGHWNHHVHHGPGNGAGHRPDGRRRGDRYLRGGDCDGRDRREGHDGRADGTGAHRGRVERRAHS